MPKQSYLAELGKLLTYMTPWDRERTLEYIGKRFDEAENESALLAELGTPVRLAVLYNRGYNPSPDPAAAAAEEPEQAQEAPCAPPEWEKDESPADEETVRVEVSAEEPEGERSESAEPEGEPAAEEATEAEEESGTEIAEEAAEETAEEPVEESEAEEAAEEEGETVPEAEEAPAQESAPARKKPGFGRVFAVTVLSIFPGLPLFALLMLMDALLLVPGAAGIGAGLILAEAGTFSLTYMADALLVFGAALIVFALALALLYGGLWCAVKLTKVYFKGLCALMRGILGKGGRGK